MILMIQKCENGYLVVPQQSPEGPSVFITLKDMLTFVASQLADIDEEFDATVQDIEIVDKVHQV